MEDFKAKTAALSEPHITEKVMQILTAAESLKDALIVSSEAACQKLAQSASECAEKPECKGVWEPWNMDGPLADPDKALEATRKSLQGNQAVRLFCHEFLGFKKTLSKHETFCSGFGRKFESSKKVSMVKDMPRIFDILTSVQALSKVLKEGETKKALVHRLVEAGISVAELPGAIKSIVQSVAPEVLAQPPEAKAPNETSDAALAPASEAKALDENSEADHRELLINFHGVLVNKFNYENYPSPKSTTTS